MTFTYAGDYSTDLTKVRFHIQDVTSASGPLPGSSNFTDEELNGIINAESSVPRAVAFMFDTLAAAWSFYADITSGPHSEDLSAISEAYRKQAEKWRKDHRIYAGARSHGSIRVDGYSDDVASDDVDAATEFARVRISSWLVPL